MREFFRGWKRKAGCATLMLALVFLATWGRSQIYKDRITLWNDGDLWYAAILSDSGVIFEKYEHHSPFGCFNIISEFSIPYWPAISTFTLLSAFLLMSKSKQDESKI